MTSFLNPVSVLFAALALLVCAAAVGYVLRLGHRKPAYSARLPAVASATLDAGSESARRVVALTALGAMGIPRVATLRTAARHALHIGTLRVPAFSSGRSHSDFAQLPLAVAHRRPGMSRVALRAERRLVVVR